MHSPDSSKSDSPLLTCSCVCAESFSVRLPSRFIVDVGKGWIISWLFLNFGCDVDWCGWMWIHVLCLDMHKHTHTNSYTKTHAHTHTLRMCILIFITSFIYFYTFPIICLAIYLSVYLPIFQSIYHFSMYHLSTIDNAFLYLLQSDMHHLLGKLTENKDFRYLSNKYADWCVCCYFISMMQFSVPDFW